MIEGIESSDQIDDINNNDFRVSPLSMSTIIKYAPAGESWAQWKETISHGYCATNKSP